LRPLIRTHVAVVAALLLGGLSHPAVAASPVSDRPYGVWGVALKLPNGSPSSVYSVLATPDRIYLAGRFSALVNSATGEQVSASNVAALLPDGTPDRGFTAGTDGAVRRIVLGPDGALYVGGSFNNVYAGTAKMYQPRIARLSYAGAPVLDRGWRPRVTGQQPTYQQRLLQPVVYAIAFSSPAADGARKVYVGGSFTTAATSGQPGSPRSDMAAFDLRTGTLDAAWHPAADNGSYTPNDLHGPSVRAFLVTPDGLVYVTGEFDQINGNYYRSGLAQVRQDTGELTGWVPYVDKRLALNTYNDGFELALVPAYSSYPRPVLFVASGGVSNNLFGFDAATGAQVTRMWSDGDVQTLAVQDGFLYVGGHFLEFYGASRTHVARLSLATGQIDGGWAPALLPGHEAGSFYGVWSLAPATDPQTGAAKLYVGGAFKTVSSSTTTNEPHRKFVWFQSN
jgi:hypothetical protein